MWKFIVGVVHDFVSSLQPDIGRGFLHVSNVFLFYLILVCSEKCVNQLEIKHSRVRSTLGLSYENYKLVLERWCLRYAEKSSIINIFEDKRNSANKLWKHFGPILNDKSKRHHGIPLLTFDGNKVTDSSLIVTSFNDFFLQYWCKTGC